MKITKPVKYGLAGVALLVAFFAGNGTMKSYLSSTPGAIAAKAIETKHRPEFALKDLEGNLRHVKEWDGKVLVLNFWATWCPPCKREMPAFIELQEKYGAAGVQFVGIALDDLDKTIDFIDTMGVDYPILVGQDDAMVVSEAYGNRLGALPYTAVIDRNNIIVKTFRGEVFKKPLEKIIKHHL